jgi:hypothetical protein
MQTILNKCADLNRAYLVVRHIHIDAGFTKCDARKAEGCAVFIKMRSGIASSQVDAEIPGWLALRRGLCWQGERQGYFLGEFLKGQEVIFFRELRFERL